MHGGHIMKKPRKSQHYIIHNLVSSNHTSFIEDFPRTHGGHYSYRTRLQTHIHTCIHTKIHIKKNILTQDPEANSFYFKEFDVFISLCQDGN